MTATPDVSLNRVPGNPASAGKNNGIRISIKSRAFKAEATRGVFTKVSGTFSRNVRISNDLRAIAYPHPTIRSKYLWAHSFRFMFQFGRIDTCLFTCKLPLVHSAGRLLLTSRYYPLCRRGHTFFLTHASPLSYHYVLLTAHSYLDNALINPIFPCLYFTPAKYKLCDSAKCTSPGERHGSNLSAQYFPYISPTFSPIVRFGSAARTVRTDARFYPGTKRRITPERNEVKISNLL